MRTAAATNWPPPLIGSSSPNSSKTPASAPLLFLPNPPDLPEPPTEPFAEPDRLEFQSAQPAQALALNTKLAANPGRAIRAGAFLRLARLHRKQGRTRDAIAAWSQLAQIPDIAIASEPAGLFARRAICRALQEANQITELRQRAQELRSATAGSIRRHGLATAPIDTARRLGQSSTEHALKLELSSLCQLDPAPLDRANKRLTYTTLIILLA